MGFLLIFDEASRFVSGLGSRVSGLGSRVSGFRGQGPRFRA